MFSLPIGELKGEYQQGIITAAQRFSLPIGELKDSFVLISFKFLLKFSLPIGELKVIYPASTIHTPSRLAYP